MILMAHFKEMVVDVMEHMHPDIYGIGKDVWLWSQGKIFSFLAMLYLARNCPCLSLESMSSQKTVSSLLARYRYRHFILLCKARVRRATNSNREIRTQVPGQTTDLPQLIRQLSH